MANLPSFAEDVTAAVDIRSYGDLQARLRAMHYTDPVGVDSVPLVKKLLRDVVRVSEKSEKLEQDLEKAQREAIELSQIILPLRKENAKLTRENNSVRFPPRFSLY
jgi:centrosomal protein CEP135